MSINNCEMIYYCQEKRCRLFTFMKCRLQIRNGCGCWWVKHKFGGQQVMHMNVLLPLPYLAVQGIDLSGCPMQLAKPTVKHTLDNLIACRGILSGSQEICLNLPSSSTSENIFSRHCSRRYSKTFLEKGNTVQVESTFDSSYSRLNRIHFVGPLCYELAKSDCKR